MRKILVSILFLCIFTATAAFGGMQENRKAYINKLIGQGYFQKVEVPGTLPYVWVTRKFYNLRYDDKQAFVGVVYMYYHAQNKKYDMVIIYDTLTGKKVGVFSEAHSGLKLY